MICSQCVARNNKMSFYVFIILLFILEIMLINIKTSFMTVHYLPLQMLYRLFSPFFDKLYICLCEILFILCIFPVPKQTRMVASQNSLLQKMVMKRSVYLEFVNCRIFSIQNQYYSFPTKMITPQLILCNKQSKRNRLLRTNPSYLFALSPQFEANPNYSFPCAKSSLFHPPILQLCFFFSLVHVERLKEQTYTAHHFPS